MEFFLLIAAKALIAFSVSMCFIHYRRTSERLEKIENKCSLLDALVREVIKSSQQLNQIQSDVNRSAEDLDRIWESLQEIQENQSPKSKTNWDNLKEAFKGPARITIHERN